MEDTSLDIIGRAAVEKATILTGSTIGVLLIVPNQYSLSDTCWTYGIDHETATSLIGGPVHMAAGRTTPLIENQYEVPPGLVSRYGKTMHIITVPVMEGNRVVAVIGLGGSDAPYRESFETQLTILVSTMWHLIVRREQDTEIEAGK